LEVVRVIIEYFAVNPFTWCISTRRRRIQRRIPG
jgi:hypothetical protein